MNQTQQYKLELIFPGKRERQRPEPRILIKKEVIKGKKKGLEGNLLIHGDNLLGLKALEREYTGKIRCIYIDPPYNTKSCFTHYDDSMEHSLWLNMMKERLIILQRLLRKDGTIWISIDDDECHYLKVLCDEIFGRKNFVANVIWEKKYSPQNDAKWLSDSHDHVLVYAKCIDLKHWGKNIKKGLNLLPRTAEMNERYKNPDNDPRGVWTSGDLLRKDVQPSGLYTITTPSGRKCKPPTGTSWRLSESTLKGYIKDNRIWFGNDGKNTPRIKRFLTEVQDGTVAKTIWTRSEVGDNQEAKREVKGFNSRDVFTTPKPERLIERILYLATDPGDLVLDCFAGSGTTGAVAHKMKRTWIMIEMGSHAETHILPRLKKVINGNDPGGVTESVNWKGGGSFRFCKLAPSLLKKSELGRSVLSEKYDEEMLQEAICKLEGFTHIPPNERESWWNHGYSSDQDFIYVTIFTLSRAQLAALSEEVGSSRSLLIFCGAFTCDTSDFENLTVKKIPKAILNKHEWDQDDYSLKPMNKRKIARV